jgi:hypothetical protein
VYRHCRCRLRGLFLLVVFAAGPLAVGTSDERPGKGQAGKVSTAPIAVRAIDSPPAAIATALDELKSADDKANAKGAASLIKLEDAEPYVRFYSYTPQGKADALADQVLDALDAGRAERNVKRATEWAKQGRYDLLVDVSLHLTATEQVEKVGQAFFDFAETMRPVAPILGGPEANQALTGSMKLFVENRETREFHQKAGVLKTDWQTWGFVRARSCEVSARQRFNWLVLTRDELRGTHLPHNEWENCYIFHNSDLQLVDLSWSLLVCDGDVEFTGSVRASTVVIGGSIRRKGGIRSDSSCLFAAGNIEAGSTTHKGLYLAGGDIIDANTGKPRTGIEREKPGLKENPFGVRFFQTADVGVELVVKDQAVTVAKLTPGSPLPKYGVEVGDVITQVNDKPAKTLNDIRRELRYSVVLEAGILHITRGQEKLTRVVYFKNGLEK